MLFQHLEAEKRRTQQKDLSRSNESERKKLTEVCGLDGKVKTVGQEGQDQKL